MAVALTSTPSVVTQPKMFARWRERIDHFRVKNHLRLVEKALRRRDVGHLSFELQARRLQHLNNLHDYWTRAVFPKNIHFPGQRVPYFQDHLGTLCAMAYLVEQSGRADLVAIVQRTNNNIYIEDITEGPVLDWIQQSGLTQVEAAQIQPTYDGCGFNGCPDTPGETVLKIVPWIIGGVALITLEWLSYTIVSWLPLYNMPRKVIVWFYLTAYNLMIAFVLGLAVWLILEKFTSL